MTVYPHDVAVARHADLSDDGLYRYRLSRFWGPGLALPFVMLNPSTADGEVDDPTIRRCVGFARRLGFDGIGVWNLYAYRATKPADLWQADYPVGPDNDRCLRHLFEWARNEVPVVAAWGSHAKPERVAQVLAMPWADTALWCLGRTAGGAPRHPLYLPGDADLVRFP
jgi:hypothetical protein